MIHKSSCARGEIGCCTCTAVDRATERAAILRERAAYARGVRDTGSSDSGTMDVYSGNAEKAAAKRYPLPRATRPRVFTDAKRTNASGVRQFRVIAEQIQTRVEGSAVAADWVCLASGDRQAGANTDNGLVWTPERIRGIADLLANPTEECEADA